MAIYSSKFVLGLQQARGKLSRCSRSNKIFIQNFSQKSKYRPVKLAHQLFEPKCGSDDRLSPLIFLHALSSTNKTCWGDIPQTFADQTKRKTYTLDARNHGDSEWSDEFDFDLNAMDLLHFMDEMSFPKVVIVGHSMGGVTGIKAALREPERIEMLFLEEASVKKFSQSFMDLGYKNLSPWKEVERLIPLGLDERDANNFITDYIICKKPPYSRSLRYDISYPLRKDSSGRYVFNVNLEVILKKMKNAEAIMAEIEGIYEGPSYFLYGTKSVFQIGKDKHQILQHFPKAVFVPFETSRHFVHMELPDLFVEAVVKFIQQNEKNK